MRLLLVALGLASLALASPVAHAQSTDAFHASQVIPVVVDTASYTTRLTFTNPLSSPRTAHAYYIPGAGTTQASELDCGSFTMAAAQVRTFASLRDLCPALPPGSQFGSVHTVIDHPELTNGVYSYSAYARVQNPQGVGFSVEGFPPHTLTIAQAHVAGIRRLAATATSPAYQTNCFVGPVHLLSPHQLPATSPVYYDLYTSDAQYIATGSFDAPEGKLTRILDVFAAANAPPGDYNDAQIIFHRGSALVQAFCTVQDNTTFSADFRIGKQLSGQSVEEYTITPFAEDDHVSRRTETYNNVPMTNGAGGMEARPFVIPAGASSNTHVVQFRNPDWVSCQVLYPLTDIPVNGLEMRLLNTAGAVLAGGNNVLAFGPVYTGDKIDAGRSNSRYLIEVESSETLTANDKAYRLSCRSGSGHSIPYLVRTGGPDQF